MSGERLKSYGFATPAQWQRGLADRARIGDDGLFVVGRLGDAAVVEDEAAAFLPAVNRRGEVLWRSGDGRLKTRRRDRDEVCISDVPEGMAQASRLIAWRKWLWALDPGARRVTRYFADTLQEAQAIALADICGAPVSKPGECDIAPDGHDGVWVLVGETQRAYRLRPGATAAAEIISVPAGATRLTTLKRDGVVVLLDPGARTLRFVSADQTKWDVRLDDVVPGFQPVELAGNGIDHIILAGDADQPPGSTAAGPWRRLVLVLDETGGLIDFIDVGPSPKANHQQTIGLAGFRDKVWVADAGGLRRYELSGTTGTRAIAGRFLTPALLSPEGRERGWLRAELNVDLPPGAAVIVRYFSTGDPSLKARLDQLASDASVPPSVRWQRISSRLSGLWSDPLRFVGAPAAPPASTDDAPLPPPLRIAPLHAADGKWLWLSVEMQAGAPDRLPVLRELRVRYPQLSLMRQLPAIYRGEGDRGARQYGDDGAVLRASDAGFLRRIVAVLEATTQNIDERIERLGQLIDPATAPSGWLDFLASWLGLPWHEQLPEQIKRALLRAAAAMRISRGTRAGLLALLRCVLPGHRVRIVDPGVDFAPAIVGAGAGACAGTLPAVLLGRPKSLPALGSPHAVLGHIRLKCPDDTSTPLDALDGHLRIEITASAQERAKFDPILRHMLGDFVPLGIRFELRWRSRAAGIGASLDDFVLAGNEEAVLGGEAVLGRTILSRQGTGRLRPDGLAPGFELQ